MNVLESTLTFESTSGRVVRGTRTPTNVMRSIESNPLVPLFDGEQLESNVRMRGGELIRKSMAYPQSVVVDENVASSPLASVPEVHCKFRLSRARQSKVTSAWLS